MARVRLTVFFALAGALAAMQPHAQSRHVRIVQTNSGDDSIHLIDPATNQIVGEIHGVPINHGAAAAPDGSHLYFTSEAERVLAVVDPVTRQITKKIALTGRPNNISISRDGRFVYVGIVSDPGAVEVIDTTTLARVTSIPTGGGIHNVYVTPDNRFVVAGSIAGRKMTVIDAKTNAPAWTLFTEGIRPIAFETNPDGSTKRLFVQLSEVHGFAVVDFAQKKEVGRVMLPEFPEAERDKGPFNGAPSHGIGITPDGKTLWVASRPNHMIYVYALPDVRLLGGVPVGGRPDWVTFTPDSTRIYVATENTGSVTVIDVPSMKEVTKVKVGPSPKRNITAMLP